MKSKDNMNLSIVTTTFNSSLTIEKFVSEISEALKQQNINTYEIIIVDDGSIDDTCKKLKKIKKDYANLNIIELSKNFGHHKALITALEFSKYDKILCIDSDLEENPSDLKIFLKEINEYDFVYGVQKKRSASFITNIFGNLFYKFFNFLSPIKIPQNLTTMTLMNGNVRDELIKFKEKEIFFHGILHTLGFKKKAILIEKKFKGKSEYTVSKKINLFFDAITSFSSGPLRIFFYIGLVISSFSAVYAIFLILRYFALKISVPGFTTLAILILFFGGLIILGIGIVGIYIQKIYSEVKKSPRVTIKNKY